MKTRKEIEKELNDNFLANSDSIELEILLDIRDLLTKLERRGRGWFEKHDKE